MRIKIACAALAEHRCGERGLSEFVLGILISTTDELGTNRHDGEFRPIPVGNPDPVGQSHFLRHLRLEGTCAGKNRLFGARVRANWIVLRNDAKDDASIEVKGLLAVSLNTFRRRVSVGVHHPFEGVRFPKVKLVFIQFVSNPVDGLKTR